MNWVPSDTKASVLSVTPHGVPLLWGILFCKDGYPTLEKVRRSDTTVAQRGFFWNSFPLFFFFLFINILSSAKGASRGQFSASVPTETWKNVNRCQQARRIVLEAAELCRTWPVSSPLCTSGVMFVVSAAAEQSSGRGCRGLGGQASWEGRVCAHHKPASKISTFQGGKAT